MIDTAQELIDKLLKYYPKTDDITDELTDGLKAYVRRNNFNAFELEQLYSIIQEHCGFFPIVNKVAKLWKEHGKRYNQEVKVDKSDLGMLKREGWRAAIDKVMELRAAQDYRPLKAAEIDIIEFYDDLYYIYKLVDAVPSLVFGAENKDTYMRKVKEDFDAGVPVKLDKVRAAMNRRHIEYQQTYGAEELEMNAKSGISKTEHDITKMFSDRQGEFELSDYEKAQINMGMR